MINIHGVQLGLPLGQTKLIQEFTNTRQGVLIFDYQVVKTSVIDKQIKADIRLLLEKMRISARNLEG